METPYQKYLYNHSPDNNNPRGIYPLRWSGEYKNFLFKFIKHELGVPKYVNIYQRNKDTNTVSLVGEFKEIPVDGFLKRIDRYIQIRKQPIEVLVKFGNVNISNKQSYSYEI